MPRNASGTYSLPAGNPVIPGTTIATTWANSTLNDIGAEITDSLDRSGKGGMLAQFKAFDGLVSAPGIAFANDLDCGFYRVGANDVGFALNGALMQQWTTALSTLAAPLKLTSANPLSTAGFSNTLSPANICKCWGLITSNGANVLSVVAGFNIASIALQGTDARITFGTAMGSANYCPVGQWLIGSGATATPWANFCNLNSARVDIRLFDTSNAVTNIGAETNPLVAFAIFATQ